MSLRKKLLILIVMIIVKPAMATCITNSVNFPVRVIFANSVEKKGSAGYNSLVGTHYKKILKPNDTDCFYQSASFVGADTLVMDKVEHVSDPEGYKPSQTFYYLTTAIPENSNINIEAGKPYQVKVRKDSTLLNLGRIVKGQFVVVK